jgi:D-threo-aldose 1-dehydrogenase
MPRLYGYDVDEESARQTVVTAMTGGMSFIDTSNNYGVGRAETRIGEALRELGGLPDGVVVASKVDPLPGTSDFSGDRVRRSVEETLGRLGLDHVQLMYLHDPEDHISFTEAMAKGGAVEALVDLRDQGVLGHLGVAGGAIPAMREYLTAGVFEAVISHNRYTLVDRSAEPLIEDAVARGVAFVNAAPYGGGMLAVGPDRQPRYCYREAPEAISTAVRAMKAECEAYGVPLRAAALQFSLRDPRVTSTIVGLSKPERVAETLELAAIPVPDALWASLDAMAVSPDLWLN